jgi:hypothetical protein
MMKNKIKEELTKELEGVEAKKSEIERVLNNKIKEEILSQREKRRVVMEKMLEDVRMYFPRSELHLDDSCDYPSSWKWYISIVDLKGDTEAVIYDSIGEHLNMDLSINKSKLNNLLKLMEK